MSLLIHLETLSSSVDQTRKLLFSLQRSTGDVTIEVGSIDKGDGYDTLCIPSQTKCAQACRFCHSTGSAGNSAVQNLHANELVEIVRASYERLALGGHPKSLLISFMGIGEPMASVQELVSAMVRLREWASAEHPQPTRFAVTTMLPSAMIHSQYEEFMGYVAEWRLPVTLLFSLHHPFTQQRRKMMPSAASVSESMIALRRWKVETGNPVEVHYTLIAGLNDKLVHIHELANAIGHFGFPVKFLHYNPDPADSRHSPDGAYVSVLQEMLRKRGIENEYHRTPGADIAAPGGGQK